MTDNNRINIAAMFCDETDDYRKPSEADCGDRVVLRFRTAKDDVDCVRFVENGSTLRIKMDKVCSDELFDYYEHSIRIGKDKRIYFFEIEKDGAIYHYNRLGVTADIRENYNFKIVPGFRTPEWAKGAVFYQIYVDRFYNGDKSNDVVDNEYIYIGYPVKQAKKWEDCPSEFDVGNFYGGDLQGVLEKLDYLEYLGIEVIYLNPVFVSASNHKYDCQDYDYIDPHYGVVVKDGGEVLKNTAVDNSNATKYMIRTTDRENLEASNRLFIRLVKEIHNRGMKVILDGVFNHCGSFNKWLDGELLYKHSGSYEDGAFVTKESPYNTFFKFYDDSAWPYNSKYDGWWGHSTLPKLNYEESPKLYEYIMKIAAKWVSEPFCADGWRLDVAADLGHSEEYNHKFWREFRKTVKAANPEAIILAEHYGSPESWLMGDQWDTVMNYDAFMEPVSWFLTGMEKHSDEYSAPLYGDGESFFRSMNYHMSRMNISSLLTAMNELSNHDHSRFLTRTNRTVGRLATKGTEAASKGINYGIYREGVMIQMTWPGAPALYYGDETGVCGWTDPDNRRTFPWGKEDFELIEFHRYMIDIHKRYPALKKGSLKFMQCDKQLIVYGRMWKNNKCAVVINNQERTRKISVPVWELGVMDAQKMDRVMLTEEDGYNAGRVSYAVLNGELEIEMPPFSSALLVCE